MKPLKVGMRVRVVQHPGVDNTDPIVGRVTTITGAPTTLCVLGIVALYWPIDPSDFPDVDFTMFRPMLCEQVLEPVDDDEDRDADWAREWWGKSIKEPQLA